MPPKKSGAPKTGYDFRRDHAFRAYVEETVAARFAEYAKHQAVAKAKGSRLYRVIETAAFIAAIGQLLAYQTVELLHRADWISVNQAHEGFPWGTLISSVILITPKVIGKAFAGKALVAIAGQSSTGMTAEQPTEGRGAD